MYERARINERAQSNARYLPSEFDCDRTGRKYVDTYQDARQNGEYSKMSLSTASTSTLQVFAMESISETVPIMNLGWQSPVGVRSRLSI